MKKQKSTIWKDEHGSLRTGWELLLIFGVLSILVVALITWMISANGAECERVCGLNGHESAHDTWSEGCLCKDEKGVYNPYDERPAP